MAPEHVYHCDVDGHFTFGSLVAATPPAGIPAARRSVDGQPAEVAQALLVQQPWNEGMVKRHSYLVMWC